MKEAVKDLIKTAKPYKGEKLNVLYIINSNIAYNGFYGKTGFNNLIIVGKNIHGHYLITNHSDLLEIFHINRCSIHISKEYGCVSICLSNQIETDIPICSNCVLEGIEEGCLI